MRIKQLEEAIQIIRKMWTNDCVTYEGKCFKVIEAYCNPKPHPRPPIMVGGGGEHLTLKVVARYADWWNCPNLTLEEYRHKLSVLKEYCTKFGTKYEDIRKTWLGCISVAETKAKAVRVALNSPFVTEEARFNAMRVHIIGTPEQALNKMREFVDIGVDYFILRFLDFPRLGGARLSVDKIIGNLN